MQNQTRKIPRRVNRDCQRSNSFFDSHKEYPQFIPGHLTFRISTSNPASLSPMSQGASMYLSTSPTSENRSVGLALTPSAGGQLIELLGETLHAGSHMNARLRSTYGCVFKEKTCTFWRPSACSPSIKISTSVAPTEPELSTIRLLSK